MEKYINQFLQGQFPNQNNCHQGTIIKLIQQFVQGYPIVLFIRFTLSLVKAKKKKKKKKFFWNSIFFSELSQFVFHNTHTYLMKSIHGNEKIVILFQ